MTDLPSDDSQEIDGVLNRMNQLGAATERMFNRVYSSLNRRSQKEDALEARQRRRAELQAKIERARKISAQNKVLHERLKQRRVDVERLEGILSILDEGIIMQDEEGRVVFTNKAAQELLGTQKNFWNTELGTLFDAHRDIETVDGELAPIGEPSRIQVNNRILGAQLAAIANQQGERIGTVIILRDVTRDTLADRLKDQFVTAISHELRTPMTVIKGMSEVLGQQNDDKAPNRRLLETLTRNVDILDQMVTELLNVSEMSADTFSIRQDEVDLEPLLWSVVNGIMPKVQKSRLDMMIMVRDNSSLKIRGDAENLRWAFGHLIQNSAHYTEPGGQIIISIGRDDELPQYIVIDIIDNGVGISDKDMPHIFERFYRGDPRNAEGKLVDPRGLGQGLFIARTVLQAHQGHLSVHSEQGRGSIFTVALPALDD